MRCLERNKRQFYYCLLLGNSAYVVDENGNRTGERIPYYDREAAMYANVSPATGRSVEEVFGDLADYDHVIITDDMNCPIQEDTVLFLDKEPEHRSVTVSVAIPIVQGGYIVDTHQTKTYSIPLYDYVVKRVSRSLNSVSIAVSKVKAG